MNTKRLILACVAVFIFVFFYDWILHGNILRGAYIQTASLWRSEDEMKGYFGWLVAGHVLMSIMFCVIYALRGAARAGVMQGVGYGVLLGLLMIGPNLITYAVQPLPAKMICAWSVGGIIQLAAAGAILGAIYKPASSAATTPMPA
jgi:hypothetical protein